MSKETKPTSDNNYLKINTTICDMNNIYITPRRILDQERKTIVSGYIPIKERVQNFIRSGENLEEYRKLFYHYADDDQVEDDKIKDFTTRIHDLQDDMSDLLDEQKELELKIIKEKIKKDEFERTKKKHFEDWLSKQNKEVIDEKKNEIQQPENKTE